ncbi:MAG: formimidoylglutamase [Saprospiraceae bacterium]
MDSTFYQPPNPANWTGRVDQAADIRFHQRVQCIDLRKEGWKHSGHKAALLGFCCDEGVRRNQGRVGAAEGPAALRKAMASFAWHFGNDFQLMDAGDISCLGDDLEGAQQALANCVAAIVEQAAFPIIMGGGHETAWGSYLGLRQAIGAEARIGIINFDAHFDLRHPVYGANSGTPFWQMAEWCAQRDTAFSYFCLGINATGNTSSLFAKAKELDVTYLTTEEMSQWPNASIMAPLQAFIAQQDMLYLTIDLDAFDAAFAPGVSAAAALGLWPHQILPFLEIIAVSGKLKVCDICELNPRYDIDQRTAKLGASLIARILKFLNLFC